MQRTAKQSSGFRHLRLAVLVGAAGVSLVGGVGLGLAWRQHSSVKPPSSTHAVAVHRSQATTPFYLTRTGEQAEALRSWQALGSSGGQDGLQAAAIIVAPSADEVSFARAALEQAGVPVASVSALPLSTTAGDSHSQATTAAYVVRTAEQAQALSAWLAQGDFGVPAGAAPTASVILAPSGDEAAFAAAALREAQASVGR